jgi:hypothetical protein
MESNRIYISYPDATFWDEIWKPYCKDIGLVPSKKAGFLLDELLKDHVQRQDQREWKEFYCEKRLFLSYPDKDFWENSWKPYCQKMGFVPSIRAGFILHEALQASVNTKAEKAKGSLKKESLKKEALNKQKKGMQKKAFVK